MLTFCFELNLLLLHGDLSFLCLFLMQELKVLRSTVNGHAGPFCHRVLLTLNEKNVPYEAKYIDLSNRPQW